jgi:hypothetical protein
LDRGSGKTGPFAIATWRPLVLGFTVNNFKWLTKSQAREKYLPDIINDRITRIAFVAGFGCFFHGSQEPSSG